MCSCATVFSRGRPNVKITASAKAECAAECRNGPSAEAEILPQIERDIRPKPKPNINNVLASV